MISEIVYSKYSQAMFNIANEQHKIEQYDNELKTIRDTLQMNPSLQKFLVHPRVPERVKKHIIFEIFADDVSPLVLQFMYVMIDRRREGALAAAIDGFIDLSRAAQNIEVARIHVIKPLSAKEEAELVAGLEKLTGKKIEPLYTADPSIIGGIVIRIGDRLIDGSLLRQLQDMEHALLQANVTNEVTDAK
ncbi:F0F1 ATP synthase subunit delta [Megasphaera sueciensis]|jgi:F-type H+-transporting ATPase subunit delta|uniref:F0F1 ATP synthase subunit delta n=1 Tax=Megasphaera sueciensis TaxID=349094 RepID=UPI003D082CA9